MMPLLPHPFLLPYASSAARLALLRVAGCICLSLSCSAKVPVRAYYASEIDPSCIAVSKFQGQLGNLGQLIGVPVTPRHVGDVEELRKLFEAAAEEVASQSTIDGKDEVLIPYQSEKLDDRNRIITHEQEPQRVALSEIDLIVGGFPCQDLSGLNRRREGLAGQYSQLFYAQAAIMKAVRDVRQKQGKETYFLVENVASMENQYRNEISRVLGVGEYMVRQASSWAACWHLASPFAIFRERSRRSDTIEVS